MNKIIRITAIRSKNPGCRDMLRLSNFAEHYKIDIRWVENDSPEAKRLWSRAAVVGVSGSKNTGHPLVMWFDGYGQHFLAEPTDRELAEHLLGLSEAELEEKYPSKG